MRSIANPFYCFAYHSWRGRCISILAAILATIIPAFAQTTGTTTDGLTYSDTGGFVTIIGFTQAAGNTVTIPSTVGGDPVTMIAPSAFINDGILATITIPASVSNIGQDAFENDNALASVTISDGVASIGSGAFNYCTSLASIVIPGSVTSIGDDAFESDSALASVTISNGVTSIGNNAFTSCQKLASIAIPGSVAEIGEYAFVNDTLLNSVTISNGVENIGILAFSGCTSLSSITIPASVVSFDPSALSNCTALTAITVDPSNIAYSSINGVLFDKAGDQLVIFPEGLIGAYSIPDGVTTIGANAFASCGAVTRITIPSSVTGIGYFSFGSCSALKSITFLGNAPVTDPTAFYNDYGAVVIYPVGATGYSNPFAGLPAGPMSAPIITTQPLDESVDQDGSASLQVVASGEPLLTYQWFQDGNPISGATSAILRLTSAQPSNAGTYTVIVANEIGTVTSNPASLVVLEVPVIGGLPSTASGYLGIPFLLLIPFTNTPTSVTVSGLPPGLVYNSANEAITGVPTASGVFDVSIAASNSMGTGISGNFSLTIGPTPLAFTPVAGGQTGSNDGTGASAEFNQPNGLAIDAQGNLYIADTGNSTIRKVTPAGVVTTIAGSAEITGSADGQGPAARFSSPTGVAVDGSGNLFVTDTGNNTIREITAAGLTSTIAGTSGITGSSDGSGSGALFKGPTGIVVDSSGNLFVADTGNDTIRKVSPSPPPDWAPIPCAAPSPTYARWVGPCAISRPASTATATSS